MDIVKTGKEKQHAYTTEYRQLKKAMKEEFYLEAVAICYAIIEDRLLAFFHHAGIVTRTHEKLKVNRSIYPYIRRLCRKNDKYSVKIKNISIKINLTKLLINMTEENAIQIDDSVDKYVRGLKRKSHIARKGFMIDLCKEMKKINKDSVLEILERIELWRINRNQLIHSLLNNTVKSVQETLKLCAQEGYSIAREIDDYLVKPFKKDNKLRKIYKIQ